MSDAPFIQPPVRLCCGQQHLGALCPDGLVMCCLCFERKQINDLQHTDGGQPTDVCKACHTAESCATIIKEQLPNEP